VANQDQFLIADLNRSMTIRRTTLPLESQTRLSADTRGYIFAVADGMGGAADGEVASELAVFTVVQYVATMLPWCYGASGRSEEEVKTELIGVLKKCESVVQSAAGEQEDPMRMGTTLTLTYLNWPELFVVHVGDSRCYVLRGSKLHQITTDHTIAQQLADRGALEPEEVADSRMSSVLSQAIGGPQEGVRPDVHLATLTSGDTVLLCTDGLTEHVSDSEILDILNTDDPADGKCWKLLEKANEGGGSDNITVVVCRALEED
jgi:protein phosphatase